MVITLGQQYNVGEKPTVILYTYINRHAGTPEKQQKQKQCSTSSNMVVIIYCYIGCKGWVGGKERNLLASESDQPFVSLSLCSPTA